ncbi:probable tubulin polyglutamylase ttll-15 isoform X1 [Diabrotica virgifera virgifera]|uniref:Tubulin polyglutamylase TTLL6 n=1 Tax=Diabrotica virgifera virgifera TaxID=50390 RepID=A0ABM5KV52_DIAVI|nr:probable tubulin polyglutamylase ttll-15 isoform X1 [Diabrotica virgifera virgifera]
MIDSDMNLVEEENKDEKIAKPSRPPPKPLIETAIGQWTILSVVLGAVAVLTVIAITADECRKCFDKASNLQPLEKIQKAYWAYGKDVDGGHLKEVFTILDRLGYKKDDNYSEWDLLWAHDYPFTELRSQLDNLKPHQKVNHLPGIGHITNKVTLATSGLNYIPPAFKLPVDKDKLLEYSQKFTNVSFVQKNNDHREVKIKKIFDVNLDEEGTFLQEYVDKPLLVSGHRFDIGIYTIITSVEPLRVYIYNGEGLLRFCPEKYHPFDPENLDKYVVGDDYLPVWKIPALDYYYNELGFGMRDSLNAYLKSLGKDPSTIWKQIEDAIRTVVLAKEAAIVDVLQRYTSKRNFFELMRFDFLVDENLKIYLLEANMSPNLSSAHFPPNRLLYQQVLYNVLGLVGVGESIYRSSLAVRSKSEEDMVVSDKTLAVYPNVCNSHTCRSSCMSLECQLCKTCITTETRQYLVTAVKEHLHKADCKRIFPPPMSQEEAATGINVDQYSPENQLQYKWFQGKCILDASWC